jgi:hypothetical protein
VRCDSDGHKEIWKQYGRGFDVHEPEVHIHMIAELGEAFISKYHAWSDTGDEEHSLPSNFKYVRMPWRGSACRGTSS